MPNRSVVAAPALGQELRQGRQTPRVLLLSADNSAGEYVGYLWIGLDRTNTSKPFAWIYDIEVAEEQRGRGYGRALLRENCMSLRGIQ